MSQYSFNNFIEWIETGREIEFSYRGKRYSVTYYSDNRKDYISFTEFYQKPVDYASANEFMDSAMIDEELLKDV
ncbi:MAG: hypothetical protein Q4A67_03560 [Aerococcus sp.]|nr:hypothetical protein [Aerococcus sp.]